MLAARPDLRRAIGPEHYAAFYRAAERNDTKALEAMLACGFDPDHPDDLDREDGAARRGDGGMARRGPRAAGTRRLGQRARPRVQGAAADLGRGGLTDVPHDRDHAAVGRLLLDAGSPVDWQQGDEPSEAIVDIVNAWRGLA